MSPSILNHYTALTLPQVLAAGIVAVVLNLILPDNEIVPKDQPLEPDRDVEAHPITHIHEGKDTESASSVKEEMKQT